MSIPTLKILIAGGGIAGHSLAFWLTKTRLDISITIVERASEPRTTGQAVDIRDAAVELMKRMGIEEQVRAKHTTEQGLAFVNSSGKIIAEIAATGDAKNQSATSEYEILRADLTQILLEAVEKRSHINYIYNDKITSLTQTEHEVHVTFQGGTKDTFHLVVAADGATSKTRNLILDEEVTKDCYKFLGQYTAFFSIPSQPEDTKLWLWYNAPPGRMISTRPHQNPATIGAYLAITTPSHSKKDPKVEEILEKGVEQQKTMLHEYFGEAGWQSKRILAGMDVATDFYMSRIAKVRLSKWTNERGAVLGDAAVATMGTGTSLAIAGAYILAGELSKIKSSADIPSALTRYEEVLRPLTNKSQGMPAIFPQALSPQKDWGIKVLNSILWALSKLKAFKLLGMIGEIPGNDYKLPEYEWRDD